jgi:cell division protein FtsA
VSRKRTIAVGLDAGSGWIRALALATEGNRLVYRAHAAAPARGWRKGRIEDQTAVAASVREVLAELEPLAGDPLGAVVVGAGGPSVRSKQGRGLYEFGHRRPIERGDMIYAIELAARARLDDGRMLLQALPQDFTVDGRTPAAHPLGVDCQRLEAHALLVTASLQEHQTLLSSMHQAHVRVEETVFEAMAAAYASVLPEERAGGVAVADIGAQSTNLCFYDGDSMLYSLGIPLSGEHFTRDLGGLLGLSFDEAERLKTAHGCALLGLTHDNIVIELPAEGGRPARDIGRREVVEILEARAMQLFEFIEKVRRTHARGLALREGIVLCGGGSKLEGMVEVAEKVLGCPARLGLPRGVSGLPDALLSEAWTVAAGLAMYCARLQVRRDKTGGPGFWGMFKGR